MTYWVVVFEPAKDLDAVLLPEYTSADDSLNQSATDEKLDRHTRGTYVATSCHSKHRHGARRAIGIELAIKPGCWERSAQQGDGRRSMRVLVSFPSLPWKKPVSDKRGSLRGMGTYTKLDGCSKREQLALEGHVFGQPRAVSMQVEDGGWSPVLGGSANEDRVVVAGTGMQMGLWGLGGPGLS